jgi:chromatin modification-related protein VID21
MFSGWGGMLAAVPQGYLTAQQQIQKMQDDEAQRQLRQQQFETTNRQAPLQDRLLQAQIAHMQRPDINAQRFAQENQAAQYGLGFMGTPGAQPMPQPPQGGVPQAFQGAQPMPGVSAGQPQGMPQGQPGMQPNPFAQAPQGQPPAPQGMPQGQPQAMYQPPAPAAMQPPGQPQGMPQGQPQMTDPLAAQEQQAMNALRQRVQQELPSIPPQQRAAYAMAVQQAQQQIQLQANEARKMAMEQLNQRKQQSLESWRDQMLTQKQGAATAAEGRSERSSLTSQRDTDMKGLDQARASGMIPDEAYQAGKAQIEQKYSAVAPKEGMKTPGMAISDKVYNRLVDAAKTQFGEEADPAKVVGKTIQDTDGKQYKIVEHEGKLDFEPVK